MADITPPTIVITSNKTALKAGDTAVITFTLSEVATDFVYSDITVSGGTLSNFSGSGKIYSATFTPNKNSTAQGSVIVENFKFSDTAGNANEDATDTDNRVSFNIDTIAPTIKIGANNTYIGLNESANLTFLLSEPSTSFDISDISISGGMLSSFTGTGTTYSVVFTPTGTSNGFVNVSGGRFTDFAGNVNASASEVITLTPYNPSIANLSWVRLFGTIGNDVATGIATSQDGSIYVCGYTDGSIDGQVSNGGEDAFLTKYNSDGTKVWTRLIGTSGTAVFESDFGNALTIGLDGSIYISGYTGGNLDGQKNAEQKKNATVCAFLTKFDSDGTKAWTRLLGEVSGTYSYALATGTDGSIYSTGQSNASLDGQTRNGEADLFLTKYSTDGSKIWTRLLGSSGWDSAKAITTAIDGGIYICGQTPGNFDGLAFNGGTYDTFLTKFNSNGEKIWSRLIGTASNDYPYAIESGLDGSIYVCGTTDGSLDGQINNGGIDAFLTKYSADGTKLWTRLLGSLWYDAAFAITIGLDGFVYVSGSTTGNLDDQNFPPGQNYYKESNIFVTKYKSDGVKLWTRLLSGNGKDDSASGLATGIDGSIFISGYSNGTFNGQTNNGGVNDALLIKLAVPDSSVPQISLSSNKLNLNLSDSAELVFLLTKPSSNFVATDIDVQGGTLSNFQGSGTNYTAIFTPILEGVDKASVSVGNGKFSDALGIFNEDGADTNNKAIFTVKIPPDTTPPTIALSSNKTTLIKGAVATLTFTLSETSTTFIASDVTVSGGTISNFAGSGTTFTATFTPAANSAASGLVSVTSGVFTDATGNANADGSDSNNAITLAVDTVVPTIALSSTKSSLIAGETATLTITSSESTSNFTASDITVSGGTLSNFSGSGTTYTALFTPTANSTTPGVVRVASGVFSDAAGNVNADGSDTNNFITMTVNTVPADTTAPTIAVTSDKSSLVSGNSATLTFVVSEPTSNFTIADVLTLGGRLSNFAGNGTTFTALFTLSSNSNFNGTVSILSGAFSDLAGNLNADGADSNNTFFFTRIPNVTSESHKLSVIVDKNVIGADATLLKDLTESITYTNGLITKHIVEYAGLTFDYDQIDSLITTVTRDGDFTAEFSKEINDYLGTELNITYSAAVKLVGVASIDAVILAVAGADENYVG
jgi:hypothetical protein